MKKNFILFFVFLMMGYFAPGLSHSLQLISYPNFYENPLLNEKMRKRISPYLLPQDHPIKEKLDAIFSQSRVTQNYKSFTDAGFAILSVGPKSYVIVARHPECPGYIFKLYFDSEQRTHGGIAHWVWLTRRCVGAKKIKATIKKHKLKYFTVPDKWLYILPHFPLSQEPNPEPFILVETYFDLHEDSARIWKTRVKHKHLYELYTIYKSGYGSSEVVKNVPYTKKGKFAFVDTESPKRKPYLKRVKKYLSKEMQEYWDYLIN
jgi:hypothetical protein